MNRSPLDSIINGAKKVAVAAGVIGLLALPNYLSTKSLVAELNALTPQIEKRAENLKTKELYVDIAVDPSLNYTQTDLDSIMHYMKETFNDAKINLNFNRVDALGNDYDLSSDRVGIAILNESWDKKTRYNLGLPEGNMTPEHRDKSQGQALNAKRKAMIYVTNALENKSQMPEFSHFSELEYLGHLGSHELGHTLGSTHGHARKYRIDPYNHIVINEDSTLTPSIMASGSIQQDVLKSGKTSPYNGLKARFHNVDVIIMHKTFEEPKSLEAALDKNHTTSSKAFYPQLAEKTGDDVYKFPVAGVKVDYAANSTK